MYTGQIIFRQPKVGYRHYGVLVWLNDRLFVYDNFPGVGCRFIPFNDFLYKDEKLYTFNNLPSSADDLKSRYEVVKDKDFSTMFWNCEHFARYMSNHQIISTQTSSGILLSTLLFII